MDTYSDNPILKISDDLLNRRDYAMRIAKFLITEKSADGMTVSINGKWGSGKTSFINLIKQSIDILCSDGNVVHPMIINFSPWNATSSDMMIQQFFECLKSNFSFNRYKKLLKIISVTLSTINIACDFVPIPKIASKIVSSIEKGFKKYVDSYNKDEELETVKNKVDNCLKLSPYRFIVFVDDIDRLNDEEIVLLIQLVKSVCSFSNITYVLSYDKDVVSEALKEQQSYIDGDKYLEKIVQVEFDVPSIMHSRVINILSKDLDLLLEKHFNEQVSRDITTYYSFGLFSQIETIRDEKRFVNRLNFEIDSFADEIDIADLVAITYLRCIDKRIIDIFISYQQFLFGGNSSLGRNNENKLSEIKNNFFNELKDTRLELNDNHRFLIEHMFPNMFTEYHYNEDQHIAGKLCYPSIFHKYLQMDFDDDDFSLGSIKKMLEFNSFDEFDGFYKNITNGNQGKRLLQILKAYSEKCENCKHFEIIFQFLFTKLGSMSYARPFFFVEKDFFVGEIVKSAIKNIGQDNVEKILKLSINNYSDLYSLCVLFFLSTEEKESKINFSDSLVCVIKERLGVLIDDYLKNNILSKQYRSEFVIRIAIDYYSDMVKNIVKESNEEWLSHFISSSIYISSVHSNYIHLLYGYDEKRMFSIVDKSLINIDKMIGNSTSAKEKQRLIVFKMQINGERPKEHNMFYAEEIQSFCDKNSIRFDVSDSNENS